ncbi:MAG: molecular chaperone TorD family protein [Gammaproteobacteria bacterium]|nr:molecular chaperone TorD family protein [Gammaproteobacteria bacterium]MDH5659497.1 molecular chaperone TorD family protein [Gammaproteobacteria bacterium]
MLNQAHVNQVKQEQEKVQDDSDQIRASSYALLANLLAKPPSEALLSQLQGIETDNDDEKDIVNAWSMLRLAAQRHDAETIADDYHVLFIGIGRGELLPFASWYLTGFLMEKPLAHLRQRLSELGFEQQEDVHEPEDHAAALCEVISQLILDEETDFDTERAFYEDFIGNWMKQFFSDLQQTESSGFYRAVGQLGEAFLDIENRYFSMMV